MNSLNHDDSRLLGAAIPRHPDLSCCHPHISFCHPERSGSSAKRTIRGVEGPLLVRRDVHQGFVRLLRLVLAILREIFDEAAYERFLIHHGLSASAEAYCAFRRDNEEQKLRHVRCC